MTERTKNNRIISISKIGILFVFSVALFASSVAHAQETISGRAWNDINLNGQIDENETGLGGVSVLAQDDRGQSIETITAEDGSWSLGTFAGQKVLIQYRLPTDGPLAGYQASQAGWNTVQSINLAEQTAEINAGFYDPAGFCLANPELAVSRFTAGDAQATDGIDGNRPRDFASLFIFSYNNSGGLGIDDEYVAPVSLQKSGQTGAIWGLAWDDTNKKLYQSSFVKRHAGFGPLGMGGIYVTDMSLGISSSEFVDLAAAGVDLGTVPERDLPSDPSIPSVDADAFAAVGKSGLGGLDVSVDGKTLYVMNLAVPELVVIDTETAEVAGKIPIPDLGCVNGAVRPFAVKVAADGNLFAGAVCSAENAGTVADLSAHILQLDGEQFSTVFSFSLDQFKRGPLTGGFAPGEWNPWTDEWVDIDAYPTPILSDIEFDIDGSLIIALMDRTGHMVGLNQPSPNDAQSTSLFNRSAGGDVIRICNVAGAYYVEGDEQCPYNSLPGDRGGDEFYTGDSFEPNFETALGGLAFSPNSGEVVATVATPFEYFTTGTRWFDNETGEARRGYQVSAGNFLFFGGANGLGDIEVICRNAPVEVGSRVWRDLDEDGLFDVGEPLLPNVRIELYDVDNGESLATVVSDANGRFGFGSGFGADSDAYVRSLNLKKGINYQFRTEISQGVLDGLIVTEIDEASLELTPDAVLMLDSNARLADRYVVVDFQITQDPNLLAHLDFGFKLEPQAEAPVESTGNEDSVVQPPSNVVGSNPTLPTEDPDPGGLPDELYGIPVDLDSRLFLATAGLLGGGTIAGIVGLIGLIGTIIAIRRRRRRLAED